MTNCQYSGKLEGWDVVDIDPYGSAAEFIDSAVQATGNYGLLCVTSTDMVTLCGTHADKYSGVPSDTKHCHESAVRVLHALQQSADRYQRVIVPMMPVSVDFYIRVFVQVITYPQKSKGLNHDHWADPAVSDLSCLLCAKVW